MEQVNYNKLTKSQKKANDILTLLWEYGYLQSNFTGDHSEHSTMIIELSKIIKL
jgi:hypothetical protein